MKYYIICVLEVLIKLCCQFFWSQVRKLKGSDEHLSVEKAGGGQEVLVSHHTSKIT